MEQSRKIATACSINRLTENHGHLIGFIRRCGLKKSMTQVTDVIPKILTRDPSP